MALTGGKRKVNKGLRDWVAFVKKVQKQEKLNYKDAIHRAKQRKDKGEKWMSGGNHGVAHNAGLVDGKMSGGDPTEGDSPEGDSPEGDLREDETEVPTGGNHDFGNPNNFERPKNSRKTKRRPNRGGKRKTMRKRRGSKRR